MVEKLGMIDLPTWQGFVGFGQHCCVNSFDVAIPAPH